MARIAKDYGHTHAELCRRYDDDHMKAKVGESRTLTAVFSIDVTASRRSLKCVVRGRADVPGALQRRDQTADLPRIGLCPHGATTVAQHQPAAMRSTIGIVKLTMVGSTLFGRQQDAVPESNENPDFLWSVDHR
jgi:hypothetical protein